MERYNKQKLDHTVGGSKINSLSQSRPSSATGAGGFEVLIANCKLSSRPSWILGPVHPPMMETIRPAAIEGQYGPPDAIPVARSASFRYVDAENEDPKR